MIVLYYCVFGLYYKKTMKRRDMLDESTHKPVNP